MLDSIWSSNKYEKTINRQMFTCLKLKVYIPSSQFSHSTCDAPIFQSSCLYSPNRTKTVLLKSKKLLKQTAVIGSKSSREILKPKGKIV